VNEQKNETLQSERNEEVPTPSTSSTTPQSDRYSFNYWNDPESYDGTNKEKDEYFLTTNRLDRRVS